MTAVAWQTAVNPQWSVVGEGSGGGGEVTSNTSLWFPGTDEAVCRYGEVFSHFGVPPWALTDHHTAVAAAAAACTLDRQYARSLLILSVCYPHRLKLSWSPCVSVFACAHMKEKVLKKRPSRLNIHTRQAGDRPVCLILLLLSHGWSYATLFWPTEPSHFPSHPSLTCRWKRFSFFL